MSGINLSSLEQQADAQTNVEISDNIAEDIVHISRGSVVANEEPVLIGTFQAATGWFYDMERFVNLIWIGPAAGGKTMAQGVVESASPSKYAYTTTEATDNALLDDPEWDQSLIAILDEYDKTSSQNREYLKSMAGEDGGYTKKRNVEDEDSDSGYSPVTISSDAMPFQVLYAPSGKKDGLDHELDTRMVKNYIEDNKNIRKAIGRKEAGHDHIELPGLDYTYIYDTSELERAVRRHIRQLPVEETYDDEGELVSRRGASFVEMPQWVWYACDPIFDVGKTMTNRVYGMLFNLIRASTLLNHHSRETTEIETDDGMQEAYLVEPQDVANVLSCQRTLMATTHQLDPQKRKFLEAVEKSQGLDEGASTISAIKKYLDDNDIPHPTKQTLRKRLEDLADDYLIRIRENAGPNGAHLYQANDQRSIDTPHCYNLQQYAEADGVVLGEYGTDVSDPFKDCTDPIRDQPFVQTVADLDAELSDSSASDAERRAEQASTIGDAMGSYDSSSSSGDAQADSGDSQSTLDDSASSVSGDEPDGEIEQYVYEQARERVGEDGEPFGEHHDNPHILGVVDTDVELQDADLSGTVFDPDHELWEGRDVSSESEARERVGEAIASLRDSGRIVFDHDGAVAGFIEVSVR